MPLDNLQEGKNTEAIAYAPFKVRKGCKEFKEFPSFVPSDIQITNKSVKDKFTENSSYLAVSKRI